MANYFLSMLTLPFGSDSWRRHRRRSRSLHRNYVSSSGRKAAAPSSRAPFNGPPPAPRRADALSAPLPSGAARRAVNRFLFSYLDSSRTFRDMRASGHAGSGTARAHGPLWRAPVLPGPRGPGRMPGIGDGREHSRARHRNGQQEAADVPERRCDPGNSDSVPPGPGLGTRMRARIRPRILPMARI